MPFVSKAQQGFMFENHPEIAKEFAAETPDFKHLPEHVHHKSGDRPGGGRSHKLDALKRARHAPPHASSR
jgi:hypothetical protein